MTIIGGSRELSSFNDIVIIVGLSNRVAVIVAYISIRHYRHPFSDHFIFPISETRADVYHCLSRSLLLVREKRDPTRGNSIMFPESGTTL